MFPLPLDAAHLRRVDAAPAGGTAHGRFFDGTLRLARPGDLYLDLGEWERGYLWVNGRLLGRYWHIGPQQRLFCPGVWLREGDNDVLVLDLHHAEPAPIGSALTLTGTH